MKQISKGFSVIEVMGAMAIGTIMLLGLQKMTDISLEDSKGQQAAQQQARVVNALSKYINNFANYEVLRQGSTGRLLTLELATLKATAYLPAGFPEENVYGQKTCIIVKQRSNPSDKLDAYVFTNGGQSIEEAQLATVAATAGPGNGYILAGQARGISWGLDSAELAQLNTATCAGGSAATSGHLASALFFDGPGQMSTDFLYRSKIPARPELNAMTTPLNMRAFAVVAASDSLCNSADSYSQGRIATEKDSGAVLSCQNGKWQRSGFWKDPVSDFSSLPILDNKPGDVRSIIDKGLGFMWDGSSWKPLAVDQNGNLSVPETLTTKKVITNTAELREVVNEYEACQSGSIARNSRGMILSCTESKWHNLHNFSMNPTPVYSNIWENYGIASLLEYRINVNDLNGVRPLFLSGKTFCQATSSTEVNISINFFDKYDHRLGYAGECGSKSDGANGSKSMRTALGIQKIPENAEYIKVLILTGCGCYAHLDYTYLELEVFASNY
ncbi:shufflon system plasmid conjugative transfer pilus tip adhesin PilV [Undibacterium sp. TS12]|uniref:shufflon system plasmid conjugative transfer pilus tip adhesin PilV n=1 Tax=Undibacterium sp. TS12 TaxID=2908202 RepID=UPI001F4CDC93|nr:shufflon system plasmid conjugative transfer pilus tip adhesin PilV [Undibacterium sp. TS12]MCH8621974.1 shufflon system plasmid conjugative transfer pilus tip adhesin PilV [Undibacterium sp. TS12]